MLPFFRDQSNKPAIAEKMRHKTGTAEASVGSQTPEPAEPTLFKPIQPNSAPPTVQLHKSSTTCKPDSLQARLPASPSACKPDCPQTRLPASPTAYKLGSLYRIRRLAGNPKRRPQNRGRLSKCLLITPSLHPTTPAAGSGAARSRNRSRDWPGAHARGITGHSRGRSEGGAAAKPRGAGPAPRPAHAAQVVAPRYPARSGRRSARVQDCRRPRPTGRHARSARHRKCR